MTEQPTTEIATKVEVFSIDSRRIYYQKGL